ncbi:hypothetical protein [Gymnodinialimonas sp.]
MIGKNRLGVPETELATMRADILERRALMDPAYLATRYRAMGLRVITDPFDREIVVPVIAALQAGEPYLLVRLGDREMNLFSYGADPGTPVLDSVAMEQAVMMCADRFRVTDGQALRVRDAMVASVEAADSVGVVGLWRARPASVDDMTEHAVRTLHKSVRATSGHWRGIAQMLNYAEAGALAGKLICSAHAYFGVSHFLPDLMAAARKVLCICNRPEAVGRLRALFPDALVDLIELNADQIPEAQLADTPFFLSAVEARLNADLSGTLVLLGAGPWAEIYGEMVRRRGGVAVDIGSAFDLLNGNRSRRIHSHYLDDRGLDSLDLFGADRTLP